MENYQKRFIELAITHQALRFGEFKLKSGRISPYFFNVGQLNTGLTLKTLGECYAHAIIRGSFSYDVLFGPAYKGISLACATAISLNALFNQDIPYCFNRKEAKDHGEGGILIGSPLKGRVLIVDDVITAGTAIRETAALIKQHEANIAGIVVALDRQEKGQGELSAIGEIQQTLNVPVQAIITLEDIMTYVENTPEFSTFNKPLVEYQDKYGTNSPI